MRDEQPGQRDPAALAGREIGHRQAAAWARPDRLERLARGERRAAEKVAGEGEVFFRRQRRFEGVPVADIMEAFGQGSARRHPRAGSRPQRAQAAGEDVEQGGFARAVAAGDHQGLAGREGERNALENAALAPLAGQIVNAQTQPADDPSP